METVTDTTSRHFSFRRFILLSILITIAGFLAFVMLLAAFEYNLVPFASKDGTQGALIYDASFVFDPLLWLYGEICVWFKMEMSRPILIAAMFSYGPFWALVIELFIKFRPRKRPAVVETVDG